MIVAERQTQQELVAVEIPARVRKLAPGNLADLITLAPGVERKRFQVVAPFTGTAVGSLPACGEADVELAVRLARVAQRRWARTTFAERRAIFARYHDLLLARQEELLDLVQLETGKARHHALEELFDAVINSGYYAYHSERHLCERAWRGLVPLLTRVREVRHPVGVVGIIAPWNYPLTLAVSDAIPALMAGNAVVLKPSALTPFTALHAVRLLGEAGLPPDLFQVVTGRGETLGSPLIDRADYVMFTGGTATGRGVARRAGEKLIPCSMELGGKNPIIVLDDADLDRAVGGALRGAFANSGQLCISFERLYIQDGIYDRFVEAFLKRTRALRLGAAFEYGPDMGSLTSEEQLRSVQRHVDQALEKGARLLAGGRHRPDVGPYFYEPTVLADVTAEMHLCDEETFGPVVAVYRFRTVAEAVRRANGSAYGLNASVWTRNSALGWSIARALEAGTVNVNEAYGAAWGSVDAPMGGVKASGLGRRHGREGILKYTRTQTIAEQRLLPLTPSRGRRGLVYGRVLTAIVWLRRRIPGLR